MSFREAQTGMTKSLASLWAAMADVFAQLEARCYQRAVSYQHAYEQTVAYEQAWKDQQDDS